MRFSWVTRSNSEVWIGFCEQENWEFNWKNEKNDRPSKCFPVFRTQTLISHIYSKIYAVFFDISSNDCSCWRLIIFYFASWWQLLDMLTKRQTCIQNVSTCSQNYSTCGQSDIRIVKAENVYTKLLDVGRAHRKNMDSWKIFYLLYGYILYLLYARRKSTRWSCLVINYWQVDQFCLKRQQLHYQDLLYHGICFSSVFIDI